jgi:hypothetical protein
MHSSVKSGLGVTRPSDQAQFIAEKGGTVSVHHRGDVG